jgi:hypothetical protein
MSLFERLERKMKTLFVVLVFAVSFSVFADEVVVPATESPVGGMGFVQGYVPERGDLSLTKARVRLWTKTPAGFYADVDARAEGNEVQQLFLYRKSSLGEIRVGRVFLAGCYSTPPPFLSRTAKYPRSAFAMSAFGTGVQLVKSVGEWSMMADVTGTSSSTYKGSLDRVESSARFERKLGANHFAAASYQVSDDFIRVAVDGGFKVKDVEVFLAAYHTDELVAQQLALLANAEWRMWVAVRPHLQFDRRQTGDDVVTAGLGIGSVDNYYLAIDREFGPAGEGYIARAQYRFKF